MFLFYIINKKVPEFEEVSESAKDLIKKMLVKPSQRLTASQVLNHPWMKEDKNLNKTNLKLNWGSLKSFNNYDKLKKVALTYIASQLSENEISELGKLFKKIDKNGDGVLTIDEMKAGLFLLIFANFFTINLLISFLGLLENQEKFSGKEIQTVMESIDTDGNGTINYTGTFKLKRKIKNKKSFWPLQSKKAFI